MHQLSPSRSPQRGVTLIESLVAIVVMALGILGIVGVQMRTLTDTRTTVSRAQAIRLTEDLSERMRINPNALVLLNDTTNQAKLLTNFGDAITTANLSKCSSSGQCEKADLAAYDLATWTQAVQAQLPLGKAQTFLAPDETDGSRRLLGVMLAWRENERNDATTTYKTAIDTSQGGGIANQCEAGYTCHLQYISIGNRCAPDANYPGLLFCPGA